MIGTVLACPVRSGKGSEEKSMKYIGEIHGLRLARIAAESVLKEKIAPAEKFNKQRVGMIARQLKSIVAQMEKEWELNPSSAELGEAFLLLDDYIDCLAKYDTGLADSA
jgi:hypothetical protein